MIFQHRMRFYFVVVLALLGPLFLVSCDERKRSGWDEDPVVISVEVDSLVPVNVDSLSTRVVLPEMVSGVDDILLVGRDSMIIKAGNQLVSLYGSPQTTASRVSNVGRGPQEYISLWDFGVKEDTLFLYDIDQKRLLFYSFGADYIRTVSLSHFSQDRPFQSLAPLGNHHFVGKRVFGMPDTPELSLYDAAGEYECEIPFSNLRSGIRLWRQFFPGADEDVLYAPYFSNSIFRISGRGEASAKYRIDFGKHSLSEKTWNDEYEAIDRLNADADKYATMVSNIRETPDVLSFQFAFRAQRCLCIFDRKTGEIHAYRFYSSSGMEIEQVIDDGKRILVFWREGDVLRESMMPVWHADAETRRLL